ncbi:MAG: Gfo/Idh/MocA family oxidoreductase [Acidobacteria bacterium]|nr:Gfo/Idh/MocA family oxidoreductase [Acidobacteriota bacterium]
MPSDQNRRNFLGAAAAAFTIVPRHVLGGVGVVAPSDRITLGYIGVGTQGIREMLGLLAIPEIRIVAVCDPNQHATGYRDFSAKGLLNGIRRTLNKPDWSAGSESEIPCGRDAGRNIVETYYRGSCAAYADFRELLDKEKDLNAVKVMTPDHLHGVVSIAAMKKGKHVLLHKPIANRLKEGRLVIDTARQTGVATHFLPWESNGDMAPVLAWIRDGALGTLREVHNWSNRPVWPQYATIPTDNPPVPEGFNWDLWLGPEADRPYHPNYTHMVFRGWYDFGGGSMADMGHYSLWSVFNALQLDSPTSVDPMFSHNCIFRENVAATVKNDFSFPMASSVRFEYPARGQRPAISLIWHDGGMRPPTPEELEVDGRELPAEGMLFVGDKGKILSGFLIDGPRLIPERRMSGYPAAAPPPRPSRETGFVSPGMRAWITACRGGAQSPGSFLQAAAITEAVNLYSVALRTGRKLRYDAANQTITNIPEANRYLAREYRKGWDPKSL